MMKSIPCPWPGCEFAGSEDDLDNHEERMAANNLHESQVTHDPQPFCIVCYRLPSDIMEYSPTLTGVDLSADEYVKKEEGTYNRENGHFLCTKCYIGLGMPSSSGGWTAP